MAAVRDLRLCGVWRFRRGSGADLRTTLLTLECDGTFTAVTAGEAGYVKVESGRYTAADGLLRLTPGGRRPWTDPGQRFRLGRPTARYEFCGRDKLLIRTGSDDLLLERIR